MKLGWALTILGGGYLLFRVLYAVAWGFWSTSVSPWSDAGGMLGQALVIGGTPLFIGIYRIIKYSRHTTKEKV